MTGEAFKVEFRCYHYNTGAGDNHFYNGYELFETLAEAQAFQSRISEQLIRCKDYETGAMSFEDFEEWKESFDIYDVENGFIDGPPIIYRITPELKTRVD